VYIGESQNIERRWIEHQTELASGNHGNYKLQQDYDLYGKDVFNYNILEEMDCTGMSPFVTNMQLLLLENNYIRQYNSIKNGYNIENTVEKILLGEKHITNPNHKLDQSYLLQHIIIEKLKVKMNRIYNKYEDKEFEYEGYVMLKDMVKIIQNKVGCQYKLEKIKRILLDVDILSDKNTFNKNYTVKGLFFNKVTERSNTLLVLEKGKDFLIDCFTTYKRAHNLDLNNKDVIHMLAS